MDQNINSNQFRTSLSPISLTATISLANGKLIELGTLSMISISSHANKFPVTSLSTIAVRGFTRGHRVLAGSLVFKTFDRSAFTQASKLDSTSNISYGSSSSKSAGKSPTVNFYDSPADELPNFDIYLTYEDRSGGVYIEIVRGVVIVDEGSVRSIDLPDISESYSFMARDRVPLQPLTTFLSKASDPKYVAAILGLQNIATFNQLSDALLFTPSSLSSSQVVNNLPLPYSQTVFVTVDGVTNVSGVSVTCNTTGQTQTIGQSGTQFNFANTGTISYTANPGVVTISGITYRTNPSTANSTILSTSSTFSIDVGTLSTNSSVMSDPTEFLTEGYTA